jgi:hypothetical protein
MIDETVGLYDICKWFIEKYPEDIFVGSSSEGVREIVKIRKSCKRILEMSERNG